MKITLMVPALLVMGLCHAQNSYLDYRAAVKVYNLSSYQVEHFISTGTPAYSTRLSNSRLNILHPTIAVQWRTVKGNFHETELIRLSIERVKSEADLLDSAGQKVAVLASARVHTGISARYEFILTLGKSKEKKIVPSVGFAAQPHLLHSRNEAPSSAQFPSAYLVNGVRGLFTPRLTFYRTSRLFLDLNVPICLFDLWHSRIKVLDPRLPAAQQVVSNFNLNVLPPIYSLRVGAGLKF